MITFGKSGQTKTIAIVIFGILLLALVIYWAIPKKHTEEQGAKSLNLILAPIAALVGDQITPSASCSPNCKEKTIFFKEYSSVACTGKQISFCVSSDFGCTGFVFAAPSQTGVHGYVACLDRNGDNNFNGEEESSGSVPLVVKSQ